MRPRPCGIGLDSAVDTGSTVGVLKTLAGTWLSLNAAVFYIAVCASNAADSKWARVGIRVLRILDHRHRPDGAGVLPAEIILTTCPIQPSLKIFHAANNAVAASTASAALPAMRSVTVDCGRLGDDDAGKTMAA